RFGGHRLYIHTNENAPKNRIVAVSLDNLSRGKWVEVVPESSAVLQDFAVIGEHIAGLYLENVHSSVRVFTADGKRLPDLATPSIGSVSALEGSWSSSEAFLQFTSFNIPTTVYRFDIRHPQLTVFHRLDVPFKGEDLEVKQVWVDSKDKTKVPMFLVHNRNIQLDGSNPVILTGYGGFNLNMLPAFSARAAFWVELGGVFALPALRGGGELGEPWHQAGMKEKK